MYLINIVNGSDEVIIIIEEISNRVKYPVQSFQDLVLNLGEGYQISIGKQRINLRDLKNYIPKRYFPVYSKLDFIGKAIYLYDNNKHNFDKLIS